MRRAGARLGVAEERQKDGKKHDKMNEAVPDWHWFDCTATMLADVVSI
jgi:hypothetical protein